jgi:hypothetical protein
VDAVRRHRLHPALAAALRPGGGEPVDQPADVQEDGDRQEDGDQRHQRVPVGNDELFREGDQPFQEVLDHRPAVSCSADQRRGRTP